MAQNWETASSPPIPPTLLPRENIPAPPPPSRGAVEQAGQNHFQILVLIFGSFWWQRTPCPGNKVPSREPRCQEEAWRRSRVAGPGSQWGLATPAPAALVRVRTWGIGHHFSSSDFEGPPNCTDCNATAPDPSGASCGFPPRGPGPATSCRGLRSSPLRPAGCREGQVTSRKPRLLFQPGASDSDSGHVHPVPDANSREEALMSAVSPFHQ